MSFEPNKIFVHDTSLSHFSSDKVHFNTRILQKLNKEGANSNIILGNYKKQTTGNVV